MKHHLLVIVLTLLTYSALGQIYTGSDGTVVFVSEAPLETIKATSSTLKGAVDPSQNTFAFSVEIASFDGFNSTLQKTHFNENYLESSRYPTASFSGEIIEEVDWQAEQVYEVRAKGILKVHGVEQERIIKGTLTIAGDRIEIASEFTVLLSEHRISIPKIVAQKISKEINVVISSSLSSNETE